MASDSVRRFALIPVRHESKENPIMHKRQALRFVVGLVGLVGFSILMGIREELTTIWGRAAIAGLAALIGISALFYVLYTKEPTQRRSL
jgi:uncharacterized membrane protein YuzA (DUF378 family)